MSRFFKPCGQTISDRIKALGVSESITLEMTADDGFQVAMKAISAMGAKFGYRLTTHSYKAVPTDFQNNNALNILKVERVL